MGAVDSQSDCLSGGLDIDAHRTLRRRFFLLNGI
jgi:hypothetical protein